MAASINGQPATPPPNPARPPVLLVQLDIGSITLKQMMRLVWLWLCATIAIGLLLCIPFAVLFVIIDNLVHR